MTTITVDQTAHLKHYGLLGGMLVCYALVAIVALQSHDATTAVSILFGIGTACGVGWYVWQRLSPTQMDVQCLKVLRLAQAIVMLLGAAMFAMFSFVDVQLFVTLAVFTMLVTLCSMLQLHTFQARTRASIQLEWRVVASITAFIIGFSVVKHLHYWSLKTLGFVVLMAIVIVMIFVLQQILNICISGKQYPMATTLLAVFFIACHMLMTICLALTYFSDASLLWLVVSLFILSLIGVIALATWQMTLPYAGSMYLELLYVFSLFMLGFNLWMLYVHFSVWTVTCTLMSVVYAHFLLDEW